MAPVEGRTDSSIFEGWEKWQIAVVVGAPVCLGLAGLWWYNRGKSSQQSSPEAGKPRPTERTKVQSPSANQNTNSEGSPGEKHETGTELQKAQDAKNNGNKLFKQGKYADAIKCYSDALEICPPSNGMEMSTFYANRAAAYEKLKNPKAVIENCTEAIKLNCKYTKAYNRRANAAEQLGDLTMSLEDVTAVCILEGFQNQTTLQMADRVLKNLGKVKAKEALKEKRPGMPSSHFVKSYFKSFTQDPVQKCFTENSEDQDKDTKPDNVNNEGAEDGTQSELKEQTDIVNGEPDCPFRTAVTQLREGQYDQLISLCTQELDQESPSQYCQLALLLRGTMYYIMSQPDEALSDFNQLLDTENLDKKIKVNALIKRGIIYITQEKQTEGLADFAQAVRVDPNNSDIYHHRGHQNIQLDRLEDAIRDFENSILKNPDFPNSYIQKSYAEHRRAAAEQSTIKLEKAIKSYEETLKKFPQCADGHGLYAQALCDLGRFDDADNEFETAIKLEPDNASNFVHRALLKLQWKQTIEEPVNLIKQAIELDDKCEYAYEILGTIEVQRGDMVKAVGLFEKAIKLSRTENELSHLFSLLHAAKAQLKAAKTLQIPLPSHFSPM